MRLPATAKLLIISLPLSGCGTYIPSPQEFYENPVEAPVRVQTLIQHVVCELKTAVQTVLVEDVELGATRKALGINERSRLDWLRTWAAQLTLTLTVDEKSSFNPSAVFNSVLPNYISSFSRNRTVSTPQSSAFSIAAAFSTNATTKQTHSISLDLGAFADQKSLLAFKIEKYKAKAAGIENPRLDCLGNGEIFLRGDLKLTDWLRAATAPAVVDGSIYGDYKSALIASEKKLKKDALSNQITFVLTYSGGINPSIKIVDLSLNQGSIPLFNAQRTNTQDLIITLGPTEGGKISVAAQNTILASQIGISVANSIRSAQ